MFQKSKIYFLTIFATAITTFAFGQSSDSNTPKLNSPYSKLSLGDIYSDQMSFTAGMGGLSVAITDPHHANFENPASLADLVTTSFNFGFFGRYGKFESSDPSVSPLENYGGTISELNLAFPIFNPINEVLDQRTRKLKWGMSIGLMPYSYRGFNLSSNSEADSIGTVNNQFNGRGGTYRLHWSNGFKYKNWNAGITLGYFFGKNISESYVRQIDNTNSNNIITNFNQSYGSVLLRFGVSYRLNLGENEVKKRKYKRSLLLSSYFNLGQPVNIKTDDIIFSEHFIDGSIDTISNLVESPSTGTMPSIIGLGATYELSNRLKIGVESISTFWENSEGLESGTTLQNTNRLAVGVEYIPNHTSYNKYWKQIRYRVGAFYEQDPRNPGQELITNGLTLGFGFPIVLPRQQTSFVNLSFAFGQSGNADLLQETYFKTTVGFTLNDNTWFFKRKFD